MVGAAEILENVMANSQFAVLSLTEAAAARARELIEAAGRPVAGLRVGRQEGRLRRHDLHHGSRRGSPGPPIEVIEDQGVKILIAPKDLMFLLGTKLDFETTTLQASFTFQNPNQTGSLRLRRIGFDHARRARLRKRPFKPYATIPAACSCPDRFCPRRLFPA